MDISGDLLEEGGGDESKSKFGLWAGIGGGALEDVAENSADWSGAGTSNCGGVANDKPGKGGSWCAGDGCGGSCLNWAINDSAPCVSLHSILCVRQNDVPNARSILPFHW